MLISWAQFVAPWHPFPQAQSWIRSRQTQTRRAHALQTQARLVTPRGAVERRRATWWRRGRPTARHHWLRLTWTRIALAPCRQVLLALSLRRTVSQGLRAEQRVAKVAGEAQDWGAAPARQGLLALSLGWRAAQAWRASLLFHGRSALLGPAGQRCCAESLTRGGGGGSWRCRWRGSSTQQSGHGPSGRHS